MATRTQVWISGTDGVQLDLIDQFQLLRYTRRLNAVGDFELRMSGASSKAASLGEDRLVRIYRQIEGIPTVQEFEGLIIDEREAQRGREPIVIAQGKSFLDLLDRRQILYRNTHPRTIKVAVPAETVLKEFVDHNAGPGATTGGGRLAEGVTTGLSIAADTAAGRVLTGQRTLAPLLATLQRIALVSGAGGVPLIDFDVVGLPASGGFAAFQFVTFNTGRGVDRSQPAVSGTALNAAGFRPIVFSPTLGTLEDPELLQARDLSRNRVLSIGMGIGLAQLTSVIDDTGQQGRTPWALREAVFSAARERTATGLDDAGRERLQQLAAVDSLGGRILQRGEWLYGRDYFLGDTVTMSFGAFTADKRVVGVTITVADGEERVDLELADPAIAT